VPAFEIVPKPVVNVAHGNIDPSSSAPEPASATILAFLTAAEVTGTTTGGRGGGKLIDRKVPGESE
jgi:hypothetical protein